MKAGKVWGSTEVLLATPTVEIHRLTIVPFAHCSKHRHMARHNSFLVLEGRLFVEVSKTEYNLTDVTELKPQDMLVVEPGLFHRFRTKGEGCVCLEVYYPSPLGAADIERQDVGGRDIE